jgi:hypothetical protein
MAGEDDDRDWAVRLGAEPLREMIDDPRARERWPYEPPAPDDGGAGVREPRRPKPEGPLVGADEREPQDDE